MNKRLTRTRLALALTATLAIGLAGSLARPAAAQPAPAKDATKDAKKIDPSKATKKDQIIFKNGRQVDGVILEETETTVKMLVIVSDSLRTEATYQKAEILELKRDAIKPAPAKDGPDADKDAEKGSDKGADSGKIDKEPVASMSAPAGAVVDANGKPIPDGTLKIYMINASGEFGRNMSNTPLKEIMDDVARVKPDVLVMRFDHAFGAHGEETVDFDRTGEDSVNFAEKARELDVLITDRIASDPAFTTKPRTVAWIKKAMGPAAFLPFVFPEIYFTSDGHHGGIGGMQDLGKGADQVVREKWLSARLARLVGLAEKGGHDGRIIRAMGIDDYILSYRIVGGQVEFLEHKMPPSPEWFLLKDDGSTNDDRADSMQDIVRMKGNDYLTLDARTAFDIGFSRGTADTVEELVSKMGITRNYAVVKGRSRDILKEWGDNVSKAESTFQRLIREMQRVQVKPPGGYKERTAARSQRKNYLRQMRAAIEPYKEAINPYRLRGEPDDIIQWIELRINELETAQKLDRPD